MAASRKKRPQVIWVAKYGRVVLRAIKLVVVSDANADLASIEVAARAR